MDIRLQGGDPELVLAAVADLLAQPETLQVEWERVQLGSWAAIHVYLKHTDADSEITPPFMEAFLELQRQLYQFAAYVNTGIADISQLSDFDRQDLQISVVVTSGSSDYLATLQKPLERILKRMIGKMSGRQAVIVIIGVAALVAGPYSFSAWLEHKRLVNIEELKSQEHVEALKALSFATEKQGTQVQQLITLLEQQGEVGRRALDVLSATNEALLKAASRTPQVTINDQELTREEAGLLRVSPKKKPEPRIVQQQMRVVDINTSDLSDLKIVLMDPDTKAEYKMKFRDNLFAGPDRGRLFDALEDRLPIWVELSLREVDGEVRSVQLLRCIDPPDDVTELDSEQ